LFGVEDTRPTPADNAKTEEELKKNDKTYELHTYENAGHAFRHAPAVAPNAPA
jgi:carboxymethylenebutenolidase